MDLLRVTAQWTGFQGAPGYSNFFFAGGGGLISDAQQVADRVSDAFTLIRTNLPNGASVRPLAEVHVMDHNTGMTSNILAITPKAAVVGNAAGGYAAASGAVVNWRTSDLRAGRRIRGRTFIVPMSGTSFDSQGTLTVEALAALNAFGNKMTATDLDSELGVWARPINGAGGVFATVTGFTVPDKAAVLRSRRD